MAVKLKQAERSYEQLWREIEQVAAGLLALGVARLDRVAIYLPKTFETVTSIFGASLAGAVFVPVNPLLKRDQVAHILRDCNVRVLITSASRLAELEETLAACPDLRTVVVTDGAAGAAAGRLKRV